MLRSAGAVGAGLVTIMLVVIAGTFAAAAILIPGGIETAMSQTTPLAPIPADYMAANLLVSFGGAVLGGWLTARLARRAPIGHALALAAILAILSIAQPTSSPGQPAWYSWVIILLGVAGVMTGGWLSTRGRRSRDHADSSPLAARAS